MPPTRPGVTTARPSPNTPMSERQQMALLIQMTATNTGESTRIQQQKKNDHKKSEDTMEDIISEKQEAQECNREKVSSEDINIESKKESTDVGGITDPVANILCKRTFSDIDDDEFDDADDVKKKKRKDSENSKEIKSGGNQRVPVRVEKNSKQNLSAKNSPNSSSKSNIQEKDQPDITKVNKQFELECEEDEFKANENLYSGGLKVPPLKIVIPQQNCTIDTDGNVSRTGKVNTSRNAGLPYVVSSSNDSNDRDSTPQCNSPNESQSKLLGVSGVIDEKNMKALSEDKNLHRVLRSSHRSGAANIERSSNNSSPQMQSNSPSPASLNANETVDTKTNFATIAASPVPQSQLCETDTIVNLPSPSTSSTSSSKEIQSSAVDLHPRKRKIRSKNEETSIKSNTTNNTNPTEISTTISDAHPHDFPFTNCFQMYLNIRRQIEKKWKNVYPVEPRPPQGYNDYLIIKRNYLLRGSEDNESIDIPNDVPEQMKDIFTTQEKERRILRQRHIVEREKLCLNVEQEIIRVHSKAARNIACQSAPYSVCTFLKDAEVYNLITPEQEEKDRNARYRFNGRLLLGWLQDVDCKWEKIKEAMLLRHHNEAESLHAVQKMDWEISTKKYGVCDIFNSHIIDKNHVPIVYVSDDFDLLPA